MFEKINPWKYFRTFYSANYTQSFLKEKYCDLTEKEKLSFENSYTLIYYLEHAKKYYDQAKLAPYEIQPVLLFYGMIQLMKATILTVDPNYPETTQVLAHGVSTRKRKKLQYDFLLDEVKIQRNGLITHFSEKMFQLQGLEGEKYKMRDLMKRIPELHSSFYYLYQKKLAFPICEINRNKFSVQNQLLEHLHITAESFVSLVNGNSLLGVEFGKQEKDYLFFKNNVVLHPIKCTPLQYDLSANQYALPANRELYSHLPEIIVHYLILYNLSMICRYETDWWGELFHQYPSNDLPFITEFLEITKEKVPFYISLLFQK